MLNKGMLAINPIKFSAITYLGYPSIDFLSISLNLSKLITQNTLYAAFYEPKSIIEISDILGISKDTISE